MRASHTATLALTLLRERPPHAPRAEYTTLEVQDTEELKGLQTQIQAECERLVGVRDTAKAENRPVLRKNAEFDMKKLVKISHWINTIYKDDRRTW